MRVISRRALRTFWDDHADARDALDQWYSEAERAEWKSPHEITARYPGASIIGNRRVCFNIRGNTYRLIVAVDYKTGYVLVKWMGTHAEYDKIDAESVGGGG